MVLCLRTDGPEPGEGGPCCVRHLWSPSGCCHLVTGGPRGGEVKGCLAAGGSLLPRAYTGENWARMKVGAWGHSAGYTGRGAGGGSPSSADDGGAAPPLPCGGGGSPSGSWAMTWGLCLSAEQPPPPQPFALSPLPFLVLSQLSTGAGRAWQKGTGTSDAAAGESDVGYGQSARGTAPARGPREHSTCKGPGGRREPGGWGHPTEASRAGGVRGKV